MSFCIDTFSCEQKNIPSKESFDRGLWYIAAEFNISSTEISIPQGSSMKEKYSKYPGANIMVQINHILCATQI